ncbi:MAG TPA: hypothetical protein P5079_10635, partial [Elusimicrobiota bacterium]|nr:hypothetical protein [Elusimicrobiota bacterium]
PLFAAGPELMCQSAFDYFQVDDRPKEEVYRAIVKRILASKAVNDAVKSELSIKTLPRLLKQGLKAGLEFRKIRKEALKS